MNKTTSLLMFMIMDVIGIVGSSIASASAIYTAVINNTLAPLIIGITFLYIAIALFICLFFDWAEYHS